MSRFGSFASRVHYFDAIGSTNDAALALANDGAPAGTAVLADQQTAGRGRRGRVWSSPAGAGLYLSVVLRGAALTSRPGLVTMGAGVAAANAVRTVTGLPVTLKWPNDLVIGDAWRKLGGILCEAAGANALVVGTGINLTPAAHPPEVASRAASIEGELGRGADRDALVVDYLAGLDELSRVLETPTASTAILHAWRHLAAPDWQGAEVTWRDHDREVTAIARDVDADGALIVEYPADTPDGPLGRRAGLRERVFAGEVVWTRRS